MPWEGPWATTLERRASTGVGAALPRFAAYLAANTPFPWS